MPSLFSHAHPRLRFVPLVLLIASSALGVVIDTGDGTGNTSAPVDDFGFENVGVTSTNTSGVYLGDSWVLTANHVKSRPITFLGVLYTVVSGTSVRLDNPSGGVDPDLRLYRINNYPNLPPVVLSSATPSVGEEVVCAGNGWNREASVTTWNDSTNPWQEEPGCTPSVVPPPPVDCHDGYKRGSGRTRRWGLNEVTQIGDVDILDNSVPPEIVSTTRAFQTVFDASGLADEFQVATGDSGGACFAKRSGTWELVGIMFARSYHGGQPAPPPGGNDTVVFGNDSVVADVFFYRDQIEALTPTPVPSLSRAGALALAFALLAAVPLRRLFPRRQRRSGRHGRLSS